MTKSSALFFSIFLFVLLYSSVSSLAQTEEQELRETISTLSSYGTRTTGSEGYKKSIDYIGGKLESYGLQVETYLYELPIRRNKGATLSVANHTYPLHPFNHNAITPEATDGTITAPLYYVGTGSPTELDGKNLDNSIVLLDFDSGRSWQQLAAKGVKAAIFLKKDEPKSNIFYQEKYELTPLQFPSFVMEYGEAVSIFGTLKNTNIPISKSIKLESKCAWEKILAQNLYALIPGTDPQLKNELLIVESFFDTHDYIVDNSPGADAASSIGTFLSVTKKLTENPPQRSVLVLATSGNAQTLAGMRDTIWSMNTRSKDLRKLKRLLQKRRSAAENEIKTLQSLNFPLTPDKARDKKLSVAIQETLKFEVDRISRHLIALRLQEQSTQSRALIKQTASQRLLYKRLGWSDSYHDLPDGERNILKDILPKAIQKHLVRMGEIDQQQKTLRSALSFRNLVRDHEVAAIFSLHLSSHGDGVGAFNRGWLYNLKQTINRTGVYSTLAQVLEEIDTSSGSMVRYKNTLRSSHLRSWDSWFYDKPNLGGEVSALAGYLGLSFVTTGDSRSLWGTPADTIDHINWDYLFDQARLISTLIETTANTPKLQTGNLPRDGFVTVTGRTNLLLQGELFANYPAKGTTILGYQGLNRYYSMVDQAGYFQIKGLADKKHVLDKLIIEGYKYDKISGKPIWAIDKKMTGKANYRLKLLRKSMKTDLVLFNCRETTLFNLLEPRNLKHMTKLYLYDGRRDAPPEHYWYSRIDTRDSIIASIYTEPGTLLKLTLSDTVLTNKIILTNGSTEKTLGLGYRVDDYPIIPNTIFHAARDSWTLLKPRIDNLEKHGIFDEKINDLKKRGITALEYSRDSYSKYVYSQGQKSAAEALALAARVYVQIEKTQKDVLFGVLFYIALFVPFAFVMERFLFNFNTIYKRIVGFLVILLLLITVIYNVHPAFDLAYSPMIVILAFFIIGLSFMVTLIIFFRFEEEMITLQRRSTHKKTEEISRWKAFVAAFFLGVSNLRRRKLRTILTCTTLIILTFTIMSFTTIKSNQRQVKLLFQDTAPYKGLLLKKMNWQSLPSQASEILMSSMGREHSAPRVWLEAKDPTRPTLTPLRHGGNEIEIQGLIGLSPNEKNVTGAHRILTNGRWFREGDRSAIILEESMAKRLGILSVGVDKVLLWGTPFTVIGTFTGKDLEQAIDLDGEPLTPVIFPDEATSDLTEAEMDALESGNDVRSFQSRYQHISATETAIVPAKTLLAAGGKLKNIAVAPPDTKQISTIAQKLSDRFSLAIFTGEEDGVWLYNISDTMNYSGVPNIIIPLLISILIVLNTMISSVYERKNEIGVYTSVGLAPTHVAFLFIAEAMALAIISVVLGYLVAQVSAALLSATPFWDGITVNYSSMAGVAAMILVIGVVLISVIYPSRVAARIAIPDVNRTFKLADPVDNRIVVTLPFLMKYREHESIGGFIYDYFISHQDVSHGIFSTGPVEVVFSCSTVAEIATLVQENQDDDDLHCLHIRSNVWLAPFDFGILQTVDVQFCPATEGEEFLEIRITLGRKAGEAEIWQRINTSFLHEFRKQLLIWRSFDESTHRELEHSFREVLAEKNLRQESN